MATSKKSAGGRNGAPSKAAASKGGRASGGGNSKKSSGGARGGAATKAAAPKKAAASKSAGGRTGGTRGAAGSTAAAAKGGRNSGGGRGAASKATASKATASRGGASRGTSTRGAAGSTAAAARGGRNSGGGRGGATASRGRTGTAASRGRGAQQASDPRNDLEKLMVDGLKDIYYAEKALVKALNRMSKSASNEELKAAFDTHRTESEEQIRMLEGAFQALGQRVQGKKCVAMDGILEEGKEHMEEASKGGGRDAVMIVSAQKAEHYEIAAYGSLRTFAQSLGNTEVAQIFEQILDQEKATDEKLTGIAETVNREALGSHNDTEGGEEEEGGAQSGGGRGEGGGDMGGDRADVAPIPAETLDITV